MKDSQGIVDAYKEILGIKSLDIIGYLIVERSNDKLILDEDLCFCNSGVLLRLCSNGKHLKNYRSFLLIDQRVLLNDLKHFKNVLTQ